MEGILGRKVILPEIILSCSVLQLFFVSSSLSAPNTRLINFKLLLPGYIDWCDGGDLC
jgi:hypothetical protein